jgi:hypothetical protein
MGWCGRAAKGRRRRVAGSGRLKTVGRSDLLAVSAVHRNIALAILDGVATGSSQCRGPYHGPSPRPRGTFVPAGHGGFP